MHDVGIQLLWQDEGRDLFNHGGEWVYEQKYTCMHTVGIWSINMVLSQAQVGDVRLTRTITVKRQIDPVPALTWFTHDTKSKLFKGLVLHACYRKSAPRIRTVRGKNFFANNRCMLKNYMFIIPRDMRNFKACMHIFWSLLHALEVCAGLRENPPSPWAGGWAYVFVKRSGTHALI